jgi:hypothetical protein
MFELRASEVQEKSGTQSCGRQITNDLRVIGGADIRACFNFEHDPFVTNKVHPIVSAKRLSFVLDRTGHFLPEGNFPRIELDH